MAYDWDSAHEAGETHVFYGYLPHGLRRKVFCLMCMFIMSTLNLVVRAMMCVNFAQKGIPVLFAVLGGEVAAYYIYKLARRDLTYWFPVYGLWGFFSMIFGRLLAKIMMDWTSCPQLRHPKEAGGVYYSATILMTVGLGLYSVWTIDESDPGAVDRDSVLALMIACSAGMLASYALFLATIKRSYVRTFFDPKTGNSYIQDLFVKGVAKDGEKMTIFEANEVKWRAAIGEDVKAWLNSNLPKWLEEQPLWFDNGTKATIPGESVRKRRSAANITVLTSRTPAAWAVDNPKLLNKMRDKDVLKLMSIRHAKLGTIVVERAVERSLPRSMQHSVARS